MRYFQFSVSLGNLLGPTNRYDLFQELTFSFKLSILSTSAITTSILSTLLPIWNSKKKEKTHFRDYKPISEPS